MVATASVVVSLIVSQQSFADDVNPWRDCGIGAAVFEDNGTAAAISNVLWDLGTTAVSSASSSKNSCSGANVESAKFIAESYESLAQETAVGEGAHLTALFEVLECNSDQHAAMAESVRGDFARLVSEARYETQSILEKAQAYHRIVIQRVSAHFANSCGVV